MQMKGQIISGIILKMSLTRTDIKARNIVYDY